MPRTEYTREYRERNKEKIAEWQKTYYERNKEKIAERRRAAYKWRKEHPICDEDCFNCKFDDCIK